MAAPATCRANCSRRAGINVEHILYQARGAPAQLALSASRTSCRQPGGPAPLIKDGKVKVLVVTTAKRHVAVGRRADG